MKKKINKKYHATCEHCDGKVIERPVSREMFRVKESFIILEDIPVGVCNQCGTLYYHAQIVRRAHEIARDKSNADFQEYVPVGHVA